VALFLQANSAQWLDMKHVWGATWCLYGGPTAGPFSVRLTTLSAPKTLTARDVIPKNGSQGHLHLTPQLRHHSLIRSNLKARATFYWPGIGRSC
jgi:hypothetical protein